jgi:hypothetical protein
MRRFATERPPRSTAGWYRMARAACALGLLLSVLAVLLQAAPLALANPTSVSGLVFRDYNDNGTKDEREPAVPGVLVRAYVMATATTTEVLGAEGLTDVDGNYTLSLPVPAGTGVRVEFDVPSNGFQSAAFGTNSGTTAQFVTTPATNVNLGILRPGQYCQAAASLQLATSCYVFGNQLGPDPDRPDNDNPVVLKDFAYTAGRDVVNSTGDFDDPVNQTLNVRAAAIGTTWGLAYQRSSSTLYAGAFLKRHSGFGPGGPGAIYRMNPNVPDGAPSLWLDLNALFPGAAGADPRIGQTSYFVDAAAYAQIGKIGLGDVEMFEDDQTLFVVALGDRKLYQIPVAADGSAPAASAIRSFTMPTPTGANACVLDPDTPPGELNRNLRPFGLGVNDGLLYVGLVCTAESTPDVPANLRAYVYAFNPAAGTFAAEPAIAIPLSFQRGCLLLIGGLTTATCQDTPNEAEWRPWQADFENARITKVQDGIFENVIAPQPWLTSIDFDNGAMLIAFRDRNADQVGNLAPGPEQVYPVPPGGTLDLFVGLGGGDILRACASGAGSWVVEGSPNCPTNPNPDGAMQGPIDEEFFFEDDHIFHDETAAGAVLQVPGEPRTAVTTNDPVKTRDGINDGGVRWYDNRLQAQSSNSGGIDRVYRLYRSRNDIIPPPPPPTFGKANGLGDLEALCDPAPVEIGNRVWFDRNQDGIQSPDEAPVVGVTLNLYSATGQLLATAITNERGEYYFRGGPPTGDANPRDHIGLLSGRVGFNTNYQIRIDNPADYAAGGPLDGWFLTYTERGPNRVRDSNGVWQSTQPNTPNGYTFANVLTGTAGFNDHTFDFGFIQNPTRVRLQSFTAERIDGGVEISWVTGAETDTWGFRLLRSATANRSDATVVTPQVIPSQGRGGGGATYAWLDASAIAGTTYSYWLQEIELNGTTIEYGPAAAIRPAATRHRLYLPYLWR